MKGGSSKIYLDKCLYCFPEHRQSIEHVVSNMKMLGTNDFTIEFEGPENGWLEIYFKIEGKKPFLIEISDAYSPCPFLKKWLENMLDFSTVTSESINIDCEQYNVVLSYDYIGYNDRDDCNGAVALIQIGSDIDENNISKEYEAIIQMVVPIHLFVSKFYYSLKDYVYLRRRTFSKQWKLPNSDYFEFRKFISSVVSKTIEQKLEMH